MSVPARSIIPAVPDPHFDLGGRLRSTALPVGVGDPPSASTIAYSNAASGLAATTVQGAIDACHGLQGGRIGGRMLVTYPSQVPVAPFETVPLTGGTRTITGTGLSFVEAGGLVRLQRAGTLVVSGVLVVGGVGLNQSHEVGLELVDAAGLRRMLLASTYAVTAGGPLRAAPGWFVPALAAGDLVRPFLYVLSAGQIRNDTRLNCILIEGPTWAD